MHPFLIKIRVGAEFLLAPQWMIQVSRWGVGGWGVSGGVEPQLSQIHRHPHRTPPPWGKGWGITAGGTRTNFGSKSGAETQLRALPLSSWSLRSPWKGWWRGCDVIWQDIWSAPGESGEGKQKLSLWWLKISASHALTVVTRESRQLGKMTIWGEVQGRLSQRRIKVAPCCTGLVQAS